MPRKASTVSSIDVRVSVIGITYNHEKYISTAVQSVLSQQTAFKFEILVSEDCSTDSTRHILAELLASNPDRIRLLLSDRNLNNWRVVSRAVEVARGEYIAILDGDDFWTDPTKLQQQVDFLDRNPSFSLCFHNLNKIYEDEDKAPHPFIQWYTPKVLTLDDILRSNYIPTCSALVRRSAVHPLPGWYDAVEYGDWPMWILASLKGDLSYTDKIMGTFRAHSGGAWSSLGYRAQHEGVFRFFSQMERGLGSNYAKKIHVSRALRRRELIKQLDAEGYFFAPILQIIYGLWSDYLAHSPTERNNLRHEIIRRFAARFTA